jgi:hypothetical protein
MLPLGRHGLLQNKFYFFEELKGPTEARHSQRGGSIYEERARSMLALEPFSCHTSWMVGDSYVLQLRRSYYFSLRSHLLEGSGRLSHEYLTARGHGK